MLVGADLQPGEQDSWVVGQSGIACAEYSKMCL